MPRAEDEVSILRRSRLRMIGGRWVNTSVWRHPSWIGRARDMRPHTSHSRRQGRGRPTASSSASIDAVMLKNLEIQEDLASEERPRSARVDRSPVARPAARRRLRPARERQLQPARGDLLSSSSPPYRGPRRDALRDRVPRRCVAGQPGAASDEVVRALALTLPSGLPVPWGVYDQPWTITDLPSSMPAQSVEAQSAGECRRTCGPYTGNSCSTLVQAARCRTDWSGWRSPSVCCKLPRSALSGAGDASSAQRRGGRANV